mmetsp:Transcript_41917/g.58581  ORF Transcript_41917/g.58581 Transcript_41917/m.58581 type:complete len:87 (-) Transcript_41917:2198-2458(-)
MALSFDGMMPKRTRRERIEEGNDTLLQHIVVEEDDHPLVWFSASGQHDRLSRLIHRKRKKFPLSSGGGGGEREGDIEEEEEEEERI